MHSLHNILCSSRSLQITLVLFFAFALINGYQRRGIQPYRCLRKPLSSFYNNAQPTIPANTKWIEYRLPRSYLAVSVLEAVDMDVHVSEAIEKSLVEPYGLITWPSSILACDQLEQRFMTGRELKGKTICDIGCGTGLVTLTSILLGAKRVIALDANRASLDRTKFAVDRLLTIYPQFSSVDIEYSVFDLKDNLRKIPECQFAVFSDVMYSKEMASTVAKRSFELMVNGAEVLLTDPGRDVRLVFTDSLKSLSGVNAKFPTSISKESLEVEDKRLTMAKLWAAAAQFRSVKVPTGGVVIDTVGKSSPGFHEGFYMWL